MLQHGDLIAQLQRMGDVLFDDQQGDAGLAQGGQAAVGLSDDERGDKTNDFIDQVGDRMEQIG